MQGPLFDVGTRRSIPCRSRNRRCARLAILFTAAGYCSDVGNTLILQALHRPTLHCSSHSQFHFVQLAIRNSLAVMNFSNNESSRTQFPNAGLSNWCSRRPTRSTSAYGLKHEVHIVSPLLSTRSSTSLRVVEPDSVSLRLVLQEFPQNGTVAPSPMPRLRASCGCKPPSGVARGGPTCTLRANVHSIDLQLRNTRSVATYNSCSYASKLGRSRSPIVSRGSTEESSQDTTVHGSILHKEKSRLGSPHQ